MARIEDAVAWGAEKLYYAEIPDERTTASLLLAHTLGVDRTHVIAHPERELTDDESDRYIDAVTRRADGEPYQYIVGRQEFYGLEFEVTSDVLIPRPDTETVIEGALDLWKTLPDRQGRVVVDVGTGSGCIGITLSKHLDGARVVGTDVSAAALAVARRNAARLGSSIRLVRGDLLAAFAGPISMIVTNLPYIPAQVLKGLQVEVRDHEPEVALLGGEDGLDIYRRFFDDVPRFLAPDGFVVCECGYTQSDALEQIGVERNLKPVTRIDDLAGIPRTVVLGLA